MVFLLTITALALLINIVPSTFQLPEFAVDHLVVGGGVVGLAVARALACSFPDKSTYLVERNTTVGEEISSRNSEVIHAGLYYPSGSLKESLCIRGRHLLYQYCNSSSVPYKKTGKLIVAKESQRSYVESLHRKIASLKWPKFGDTGNSPFTGPPIPAELMSGTEARELEPDLSTDISAALLSHETGIIDSHTFMKSLERDIIESENGEIVYSTSVVRVDPYDRSRQSLGAPDLSKKEDGWVVQMVTHRPEDAKSDHGEADAFLARTLVNASGLSGNLILNSLLPLEKRIPMYFARGSYAAYNGSGVSHVKRLLYPCPDTEKKNSHAFQSLGTHLTLDLDGHIKFGPDLQWISPAGSRTSPAASPRPVRDVSIDESFFYDETGIDFWKQHLVPDESQVSAMTEAVKQYLPGVDGSKFRPDYVGIRPKLVPPWGGFQDFVFRRDKSANFLRYVGAGEESAGQMISLLGIESPGLTASLAIAEKVVSMLRHEEGSS